jgi:hypothetical protein
MYLNATTNRFGLPVPEGMEYSKLHPADRCIRDADGATGRVRALVWQDTGDISFLVYFDNGENAVCGYDAVSSTLAHRN